MFWQNKRKIDFSWRSSDSQHCLVPENIHTPHTEDFWFAPPTPQDFPFQGVFDDNTENIKVNFNKNITLCYAYTFSFFAIIMANHICVVFM